DGEWLMRREQRATAGLDALAAALRLPSEKVSTGSCPFVLYLPIIITVTDTAGRHIHPEVPKAACWEPLKAATDAIDALPWTTTGTTKVRRLRSELEVSSTCSGAWKPTIPLTAGGSGTQVVPVNTTARELRICRFDLDPDPAAVIRGDRGTPYRMGKLVSASTMDAVDGGQLMTAV